jgi:hypothetical protein
MAVLTETLVDAVAQHWLVLTGVTVTAWLLHNRYQKGLTKYPGPMLASLTDWWRFVDVYGQRPEITHRKLHAKYGDVVRLGPNSLSFADPKALKAIYGLNKGYVKVRDPLTRAVLLRLSGDMPTLTRGRSPTSTLSSKPSSRATACNPSSARPTTTST